jgi:hypothetical protein
MIINLNNFLAKRIGFRTNYFLHLYQWKKIKNKESTVQMTTVTIALF